MSAKTARNIVIVLAIAALIAFVPGSGTAASVITHAVTLAFLGSLAWFGTVLYRQNRSVLYGLGDRRRAALYLAIGAAVFALSATSLMWSTSAGSVAWLVIMGAAVYTTVMMVLAIRRGPPGRAETPPAVSREVRETIADWLMVLGAVVLVISLFLTWSHQLPHAFAVQFAGTPALAGVPRTPTAWQVYSAADVCLALVAATLVAVAFVGTRKARLLALIPAALALAFVLHAASVPPTNGITMVSAIRDHATAGAGETVATAALATALAGLTLSFTAD